MNNTDANLKQRVATAALEGAVARIAERLSDHSVVRLLPEERLTATVRVRRADTPGAAPRYFTIRVTENV